jgi:putative endonuclease
LAKKLKRKLFKTLNLQTVIPAQAGTHAEYQNPFEVHHLRTSLTVHHRPMDRQSYVYLLASKPYGTLYIGVTSDLVRRVWQHREKVADGFTKKYSVTQLVWYEVHDDVMAAIKREKQLKEWKRAWKIELIQKENPYWRDLYDDICTG